ncbi:uncharacterized protein EI90DRAFT_3123081 [Cantharellus anzutake]|uniref:uncharacterized protein n=1 Tax=Cantharellus anzutake TaxID=1750568 RepID=UPI00190358F9|nr:uncharacterized protein EI90DRAFT_3123081 [Cantharellus anzutake]KAF8331994.1 hypothetical protein EI90DRAFT_3123081 [Cantharellus anzutake]
MRSLFSKFSRNIGVKKEERKEATSTSPSTSPKKEKLTSFLRPSTPSPTPPGQPLSDAGKLSGVSGVGSKSVRGKAKTEGTGLSVATLFRPQSRGDLKTAKHEAAAPQLDLNLPLDASNLGAPTNANGIDEFGALFSDNTAAASQLADSEIANKSLTPDDANRLTVASSAVIRAQGLETLGLFHPHWLSASPGNQRKLISRFILALKANNFTKFEADLRDASPQDVAPVLKWGLRHLVIEKGSFGRGNAEDQWAWYRSFSEKERAASFPTNSFSSILLPLLPNSHGVLLKNLMELFASVAAHADGNGMFNTKLSKVLAWWIISNRTSPGMSFDNFYREWDRTARILEHVFLAYIRDQSHSQQRVPLRLKPLYQPYPPATVSDGDTSNKEADSRLPPKPRLTTRTLGALLVKLEAPYGQYTHEREVNPTKLVEHALETTWKTFADAEGKGAALWEGLKQDITKARSLKAAKGASETASLLPVDSSPSQAFLPVFSDTTTHWLKLAEPIASTTDAPSPPLTPPPASPEADASSSFRRRRSFSSPEATHDPSSGSGLQVLHEDRQLHSFEKAASASNLISGGPDSEDWDVFSSAGFGTSPNLGTDSLAQSLVGPKLASKYVQPRKSYSSATSKRKQTQPLALANTRPSSDTVIIPTPRIRPSNDSYRMISPSITQIDEAFIDTWADTLLDPSTAKKWPDFGLFQLKEKRSEVEWVIVERTVAPRPKTPEPVEESPRAVSPGPSVAPSNHTSKSRNKVFGSPTGRKRFSLFFARATSFSSSQVELPRPSINPSVVDEDVKDAKPAQAEAMAAVTSTRKESKEAPSLAEKVKIEGAPVLPSIPGDLLSSASDDIKNVVEHVKSDNTTTAVPEAVALEPTKDSALVEVDQIEEPKVEPTPEHPAEPEDLKSPEDPASAAPEPGAPRPSEKTSDSANVADDTLA